MFYLILNKYIKLVKNVLITFYKKITVIKANKGDTTIATHLSFITAGSW